MIVCGLDTFTSVTSFENFEYDNVNTISSTNEDRDLSISDVPDIVVTGSKDLNFDCNDDLNLVGGNDLDTCLPCPETQQSNHLTFNCSDHLSHDEYCFVSQHEKSDPLEVDVPQQAVKAGEEEPRQEGDHQYQESQVQGII